MAFAGWQKVVDASGNTLFVATYTCDCANGGSPKTVDKSRVNTGDDNDLYIWIWMLMMAAAAFVATAMMRNRDFSVAFGRSDNYRPKH